VVVAEVVVVVLEVVVLVVVVVGAAVVVVEVLVGTLPVPTFNTAWNSFHATKTK
jgi:hypothetical protein